MSTNRNAAYLLKEGLVGLELSELIGRERRGDFVRISELFNCF